MGTFTISTCILGPVGVIERQDWGKGCYNHHLYFDNYFSISLLSKLLEDGTYACGTIRTNRKQYPTDEAKRFDRGQSTFCQCGNIVVTAWNDKVVNVVSTLGSPTDIISVNRRQKDGTRVAVECPLCIALYNQYMGGGGR